MAYIDTLTNAVNLQVGAPQSGGSGFRQERSYTWDRQLPVNLDASIPDVMNASLFLSPLSTPVQNLWLFRVPKTGTITAIDLWITDVTGTGSATFNFYKGGVPLLSGAEKLTFTAGVLYIGRTISVQVGRGDLISMGLESISNAVVLSPIYPIVSIT